jgi:stage V sporulation protein SpoVS
VAVVAKVLALLPEPVVRVVVVAGTESVQPLEQPIKALAVARETLAETATHQSGISMVAAEELAKLATQTDNREVATE